MIYEIITLIYPRNQADGVWVLGFFLSFLTAVASSRSSADKPSEGSYLLKYVHKCSSIFKNTLLCKNRVNTLSPRNPTKTSNLCQFAPAGA